ncbi:MAG: ABC transporter substrate-binding protein, partial [Chloroflexi bacterium]|nr:ABC transporter substrate-binding protein [Chloroflexota bacterium]
MLLVAVALLAACGPQEVEQPPDQVTVQLKWVHQAQFAGFYAADKKGFYAEEGIDVTLNAGGVHLLPDTIIA